MRKDEFEVIKRKMFLEEKITELKVEYPNFKELEYEQMLSFIANKMNSEKKVCLSYSDWQYFNKACFLPFDEIKEELIKYDKSSPKMDELRFVNVLSKKYNVDIDTIISRIQEIRQLTKLEKKFNRESNFNIFSCPCNKTFVISVKKLKAEEDINKPKSLLKIRISKR